jgi:hypothetical protein
MHTIFIDIETLPRAAYVGMDLTAPPGWVPATFVDPPPPHPKPPPSNYRKPEARQRWVEDQAKKVSTYLGDEPKRRAAHDTAQGIAGEAWFRSASLDPLRLRIAAVGVSNGEKTRVLSSPDDEALVLDLLAQYIADEQPDRIAAHNGSRYDFPCLAVAYARHGDLATARMFHQGKPWETRLYDTCELWPRAGRSPRNLDAICEGLGIARDDNPITGAEVLDRYLAGDWASVVEHCAADIRALEHVYRVLSAIRGD